jgi:MFS family permease
VFGVGLRFLPLAIGSLISSNIAARLTLRFGLKSIMLIGMVMVTAGLAVFASVSATSGFTPVAIAFGLIGMGIGLVIAPGSNAIIGTLPS